MRLWRRCPRATAAQGAPLGVSSFGPIDLDPRSGAYGTITTTPKTHWAGFPLRSYLASKYAGPVRVCIDNNCSALAEAACRDLDADGILAFIGVGTGFGAAAVRGCEPLLVTGHSEFGHVYVRRHPADDFLGSCPYHGDCLEGLASGSAIAARRDSGGLDTESAVVAYYLAQAAYTLGLMLAPAVVVLGGGVPHGYQLLAEVRSEYESLWRGYLGPTARAPVEMARTGVGSALAGAAFVARRLVHDFSRKSS